MSASERNKRQDKALYEGRVAFRKGEDLDDCPYKRSTWGVGGFWDVGWLREKDDTLVEIVSGEKIDKILTDANPQELAAKYIRDVMIRQGFPPLNLRPSGGINYKDQHWACIEFAFHECIEDPDGIIPEMVYYSMTLRKSVEVPNE